MSGETPWGRAACDRAFDEPPPWEHIDTILAARPRHANRSIIALSLALLIGTVAGVVLATVVWWLAGAP